MDAARAARWPAGACWLDDMVAVGPAEAVDAYERLFPSLATFLWWFPAHVATALNQSPERLALAHADWLAKSGRNFRWDVRLPASAFRRRGASDVVPAGARRRRVRYSTLRAAPAVRSQRMRPDRARRLRPVEARCVETRDRVVLGTGLLALSLSQVFVF